MITLAEALDLALVRELCTKPTCTTCGAGPYQELMRQAAGSGAFLRDLEKVDALVWQRFDEPRGAVAFALAALPGPEARASVLEAWLVRDLPSWLYDSVAYDVLRTQDVLPLTRERWVSMAEKLACVDRNESLVETLLWLLGSEAREREALMRLAEELAETNPRVRKALQAAVDPPGA
jgi:hypothetical protein